MEVISQTFLNNFLFLIKILSWCVIGPCCGAAAAGALVLRICHFERSVCIADGEITAPKMGPDVIKMSY